MFCKNAHSLVLYAIESCNSTQVSSCQLHFRLLIHQDTLSSDQVLNRVLDQLADKVIDLLRASSTQVIVVGVGFQSSEQKGPG